MVKPKVIHLVRQVWGNMAGQRLITIPLNNVEGIDTGDFVEVHAIRPKLIKGKCPKCKKLYWDHTIKQLHDHDLLDKVL